MHKLMTTAFCVILFTCLLQVDATIMICETVEDVFSNNTFAETPRNQLIKGAARILNLKGHKGDTGDRGLPGTINQTDLNVLIGEEVEVVMRDLLQQIKNLQRRVATLNLATTRINQGQTSKCRGFIYQNKCYFTIIKNRKNVLFNKAREMCLRRGAKLADILNTVHEVLVLDLMRRSLTGEWIQVWLGMTYRPSERSFYLTTGRNVSQEAYRWYRGWPRWDYWKETKVAIEARKSRRLGGMFHQKPEFPNVSGALCMTRNINTR